MSATEIFRPPYGVAVFSKLNDTGATPIVHASSETVRAWFSAIPLRDYDMYIVWTSQEESSTTPESFLAKWALPAIDANEKVNHPSHYNHGKYEVIDVIEDWKLGFNLGNALKYMGRAGRKDPLKTIEDLEKAAWYLDREINRLRGENK